MIELRGKKRVFLAKEESGVFITSGLPIDCADITIRNSELAIHLNKKFPVRIPFPNRIKMAAKNYRKAMNQGEKAGYQTLLISSQREFRFSMATSY